MWPQLKVLGLKLPCLIASHLPHNIRRLCNDILVKTPQHDLQNGLCSFKSLVTFSDLLRIRWNLCPDIPVDIIWVDDVLGRQTRTNLLLVPNCWSLMWNCSKSFMCSKTMPLAACSNRSRSTRSWQGSQRSRTFSGGGGNCNLVQRASRKIATRKHTYIERTALRSFDCCRGEKASRSTSLKYTTYYNEMEPMKCGFDTHGFLSVFLPSFLGCGVYLNWRLEITSCMYLSSMILDILWINCILLQWFEAGLN